MAVAVRVPVFLTLLISRLLETAKIMLWKTSSLSTTRVLPTAVASNSGWLPVIAAARPARISATVAEASEV
ncbi:hypothetical protein D3C87_1695640 [compost metagenome]